MKALAESIHTMVLEHPTMSVEQLTEAAFGFDESGKPRKPKWTLYRELNPDDAGAKLAALDLVKLMQAANQYGPLEVMAMIMGFRLVSLDSACPDKPSLPEELLDDLPALAAYHDAIRQGLPIEAVNAMLQHVISDLEQDFVAYRAQREKQPAKRRNAA